MNQTTEAIQEVIPAECETQEIKALQNKALVLASSYDHYIVESPDEYVQGAEHLKDIKEQLAAVNEERFAQTRPLDQTKKRIMAFFGRITDRLEDAETKVKAGLLTYKTEQDRIAEEAARKEREKAEREATRLREEARKADEAAAKKERDRLAELQRKADEAAELERKRLAEEQRVADEKAAEERERLAERERQAAEDEAEQRRIQEEKAAVERRAEAEQRRIQEERDAADKRAEEEQERLHQEKLDAEAAQRDRTARAETLEARADDKVAAPVVSAAPKVKGVSTKRVWKFEIVDKTKVPEQYKTIDEKKIRGVVTALKEDADIPGVRVYWENAMAAGRGRD